MVFINDLSPILVNVGGFEIHWYGAFFATGILLNYFILTYLFKKHKHPVTDLDSLAVYLFFGLVIGARLGHIFFYEADYYLSNPVEILKIWNGGLASHGALIGLFIAYFIWLKVHKIKFTKYADLLVIAMPLTGAFVRLGNYFNSEIVGKPTGNDFGVVFRRLGEDFPRHPVQLYESIMGLVVFVVLWILYKKYYRNAKPLYLLFTFLFLYFGGRFIAEFFKDLQGPLDMPITMGQLLSIIPVLAAVIYFIFFYPKLNRRHS
ncbi:MAG: prolipoprotein diacylglyceryl transferase [Patescibacteria group bacterium]